MPTCNPPRQSACLIVLCLFYVISLSGQNDSQCQFILESGYAKTLSTYDYNKQNHTVLEDTVGIYFELDFALYQKLNSSHSACSLYLYNLFLNISEIYSKEGISLQISDYKIWDTPDPYSQQSAPNAIISFADSINNDFKGHLAHLLSGNSAKLGGLAYLSGLCDRDKSYAFSNVYGEVSSLDQYSWDTHVVAHEIGHNLGAPHTNDCLWGPNSDTAIDGCGQTSTDCSLGEIPSIGGTIMSSCHTNPTGVDLTLGLGNEPAALIRSVISTCFPSNGKTCNNPIDINKETTFTIESLNSGNGANHSAASHSMWYRYIAQQEGHLSIWSCEAGVDTRLFIYQGGCNNLVALSNSDDDCHSGQGFVFASYLDSISVTPEDTLLIEWDDRWSSAGFEWSLNFTQTLSESCDNGILDGDEEGIDCGPFCQPCDSPCKNIEALTLETDGHYFIDTALMINSMIHPNTNISLSTPEEVIFEKGSEISITSSLEIHMEDCSSFRLRMLGN